MGAADETGGTIEERVPGGRLKVWVLLDGPRSLIALLVLCGIFVGLAGLVALDPSEFERAVQRGDPIQTLFQALVTAIVTGVTVVVSINSLVLSEELGPVGAKQEQMDESTDFREEVADLAGASVSPAAPSEFLRLILQATSERASDLRAAASDVSALETRESLVDYADQVERDADATADKLTDAEFGTFEVVSPALDFEYSGLLYEGKLLGARHAETLSETQRARLEDVFVLLERYGPAREHIKTLYFQWELIDLSRAMLYAAVPALVVSAASILVLGDLNTIPGATFGIPNLAYVVCAAATVALSPFAVLLSYILRVATVAKRTLAVGPFVLRGE